MTNIETNTSAVLYSFGAPQSDSSSPYAITFDLNSNTIYGVTLGGGASSDGVLFSYNLDNSQYQILYNFTSSFGATAIVFASNALYITLSEGGSNGYGAIGFYNLSSSSYTGECILKVFTLFYLFVRSQY